MLDTGFQIPAVILSVQPVTSEIFKITLSANISSKLPKMRKDSKQEMVTCSHRCPPDYIWSDCFVR
jgi:hypothetical protein